MNTINYLNQNYAQEFFSAWSTKTAFDFEDSSKNYKADTSCLF